MARGIQEKNSRLKKSGRIRKKKRSLKVIEN
jgi:hypothetical protein